ncbi:MAG: CPBP family intramembrane metalloprotease [Cyclobacteriaceae bacterium]|nr:CPBP family intramembrane metalloprotease [Cyclobacteriaceae bacterium]
MTPNLVSDRPASISLLRIFAMLIIGFLFIGNVIALLTVSLLYDGNLSEAMTDPVGHPEIQTILVIAQGLAAFVGLVLIPWYYLKTFEHRSPFNFVRAFPSVVWFALLVVMTVALVVGISPITEWNAEVELPSWLGAFGDFMNEMERQAKQLTDAMTSGMTPASFALIFIVVAIIPAIGEELVFRGLIQTELQRALGNPHLGIWLTAAFFSAFHMQFFGFFPRMFIGALLGYLYFWSGNLWYPIVGHFLNNGLQLIGIYLMQLNLLDFDVESTEQAPLPIVGISLLLLAGMLYYCSKNLTPTASARDFPK